jgi:hypothetical protein
MSDLQNSLVTAKSGLTLWERIPPSRWAQIASSCGPAEIAELRERIAKLEVELQSIEEWDGDTQDDIHRTIDFLREIIAMIGG